MRWWLLLLTIGLVIGHLYDEPIVPPHNVRAGKRVVQADLHVHSRLSDGHLSPFEVVLTARRHGLDAISLSEHNSVAPAKIARWFSRLIDGPIIIVGEEVTTRDYHLLVYGIERTVDPRRDLGSVIDEVHEQGGVAIAAHPTARYWPAFEPYLDKLDGVEVLHPSAYFNSARFSYQDIVSFYERVGKTAVGTSDYHFFKIMGLGRTLLFVDDLGEASLIAALRAGDTVVKLPDGRMFGHPDYIAALEREPLPEQETAVGYAPASILDLIARLLSLVGFFGLLLGRLD